MQVNDIDTVFKEPQADVLIAVTIARIVFEAYEDLSSFLLKLAQKVDTDLKDLAEFASQDVAFPDVHVEAELLLKSLRLKSGFLE